MTVTINGSGPLTGAAIVGTTTNNDAAAGVVGEYLRSTISGAAPTTIATSSIPQNLTSLSLTAGDWEISGNVGFITTATTNVTRLLSGVSDVSIAIPTDNFSKNSTNFVGGVVLNTPANGSVTQPLSASRVSINATTTVYLVVSASFTVSTVTAFGYLQARRVR